MRNNSVYTLVQGHRMHIYRTGSASGVKLVFLSGSATVSPAYDFRILYEKLIPEYRIIVIEKFGYGRSDLFAEASADVDDAVDVQREALEKAGEKGPYVLLPHSFSGLEAIRWSQRYPDEIQGIIGLDMAVPAVYMHWSREYLETRIETMKLLRRLADVNIFPAKLNTACLSDEEIRDLKKLRKRNTMNARLIKEAQHVMTNAETVSEGGSVVCPLLMLVSDGTQVSENWISHAEAFAQSSHGTIVHLECGHYIHCEESERISALIREFTERYC